jgi:hypothetical protein
MKIVHIRTTMFDHNVTSGRLVGRTKLSHNDGTECTITVLRLGATAVQCACCVDHVAWRICNEACALRINNPPNVCALQAH